MKTQKNKIAYVLISLLIMLVSVFGACANNEDAITVYAPDGAPAVAISKFIYDNENFGTNRSVSYNIVTAKEISTAMTNKGADLVVLPVNTATKVYNQNGGYKLLAVLTHGNFYITSAFEIDSVNDLIGKVVLMPNQVNTVPDLTLKSILVSNNISYDESDTPVSGKVAIKYHNDGKTVIASLNTVNKDTCVAMLPEPAVTNAMSKVSAFSFRFDIQSAYDATINSYPQAVLMIKNSFLEKNRSLKQVIEQRFNAGISFLTENPDLVVSTIKQNFEATELTKLTADIVQNLNIYYSKASDEKQNVISYIEKIRSISSQSANIVEDSFFVE